RGDFIESRNQADNRRFSRPGWTDESGNMTGLDREVDIFQDQLVRGVTETDVVKFNSALERRRFVRLFPSGRLDLDLHDFLNTLERNGGFGERIRQSGKTTNR